MKLYRKKSSLIRNLPAMIIFLAVVVILVLAVADVSKTSSEESYTIVENSIRRAVIACYAEEGRYPTSIDYLKENYGLYVSDEYHAEIRPIADNIMPEIIFR